MEVVKKQCVYLSNYEVFALLQDTENDMKKKSGRLQNLSTIVYETSQYLKSTSCQMQTPEVIETFLKEIMHLKLTKTEKLQLLNLRPTKLLEICMLIENHDERFSQDEIQLIVDAVGKLPESPTDVAMETSDN